MRYAERAMVKAAYNSISTRLSTENPRAPPMTDFATQTIRLKGGGWSERFEGQNWLYRRPYTKTPTAASHARRMWPWCEKLAKGIVLNTTARSNESI